MEISFALLRSKEIVNIYDGKRLGRAVDIVFEKETAKILGIVVPSEKKFFRKQEDIFVPIELIKKIGEDVILVKLSPEGVVEKTQKQNDENQKVYARYRRVVQKE